MASVIPQKELRNQAGEILRRAEGGENFTITVAGRPVAQLGPIDREAWVPVSQLAEIWELPPDPELAALIRDSFDTTLRDPWE